MEILKHIVIHHQDKKGRKDIDGGDSGKVIMHTVEYQKGCGCSGDKGILKEPFCKKVHERNDKDTENNRHEPPAKGRHAKHKDAQGNQNLSKMGMGGLVGGKTVEKFVGRASVIDLVEHGSRHVGSDIGKKLLLVEKRGVVTGIDGQNHRTVHLFNHDFVYHGLVVRDHNPKISQPVIQINLIPGKHRLGDRFPVDDFPGAGHLVKCGNGKVPGI